MEEKNKQQELEEVFKKYLKDSYLKGLGEGSKAIAGVIFNMTQNMKLPPAKRLKEIEVFCKKSLNLKQKEAAKK